jgi:hypothetical protein
MWWILGILGVVIIVMVVLVIRGVIQNNRDDETARLQATLDQETDDAANWGQMNSELSGRLFEEKHFDHPHSRDEKYNIEG